MAYEVVSVTQKCGWYSYRHQQFSDSQKKQLLYLITARIYLVTLRSPNFCYQCLFYAINIAGLARLCVCLYALYVVNYRSYHLISSLLKVHSHFGMQIFIRSAGHFFIRLNCHLLLVIVCSCVCVCVMYERWYLNGCCRYCTHLSNILRKR